MMDRRPAAPAGDYPQRRALARLAKALGWFDSKRKAISRGLIYLGTIHSHPDYPGSCSETDLAVARKIGDLLIGIYELHKTDRVRFHSRTHWWPNHLPIARTVLK